MSLLEIHRASVKYSRDGSPFYAIDDVSLAVDQGETVALVGESGSGKSTLARAVCGLAPLSSGHVHFAGAPLPRRGRRPVGMVFQDPLGSLDPHLKVGATLSEVLGVHRLISAKERPQRISELLSWVGLPPETGRVKPAEMSGGQQQRVAIARALAAEPQLLILDEPVSALDVSIRAQILRLICDLRQRLRIGFLFIGHDLAVVRQLADRVAVLYSGRLVEEASTEEFFQHPAHPYSRELLRSVPSLRRPLLSESDSLPPQQTKADGWWHAVQCAHAEDAVFDDRPEIVVVAPGHGVACHHRASSSGLDSRAAVATREGSQ